MANKKRDDSINDKLIHVRDNIYKIAYRRWNGKPGNRYYIKTNCSICNNEMLQDVNNHKKAATSICSKKCKSELSKQKYDALRKQNVFEYKKYRETGGYHQMIHKPDHPKAHQGLIPEHIVVMEEFIGRYLHKGEKVHHINMIKNHNTLENLDLMSSNQEHFKAHGSLNKCVSDLMLSGLLIYNRETKTYQVNI